MSNNKKPATQSIHLDLEAPPPPGMRRKPRTDPHELHHFDDDGTASNTFIMDKTGIYKNRTIAVLRSNRFMIALVIVLSVIIYLLSKTIPQNVSGFITRNEIKHASLRKLDEFAANEPAPAAYIRCMAKNENLKIYLDNDPKLKADFFKAWSTVPVSIIPITFCKAHDAKCPFNLPRITMGEKNNFILLNLVGDEPKPFLTPHEVAFHSKCIPAKYQINIQSINNVMVVPGFEKEFIGVGPYFYILGIDFLKNWGFIFIIIIVFLGANKRPYSKRIEEHRHWSIK